MYRLICYLYGAYVAYVLDVSVGCWIHSHVLGSHLQCHMIKLGVLGCVT